MIFNQFEFLFLFLPATLVLVFLPGLRRFRTWMLAGASLAFYGFAGFEHVLILAAGIVWVYLLMAGESANGSRWRLVLAIVVPALALTYYKYSGFLVSQVVPAGSSTFSNNENAVLLPSPPAGRTCEIRKPEYL